MSATKFSKKNLLESIFATVFTVLIFLGVVTQSSAQQDNPGWHNVDMESVGIEEAKEYFSRNKTSPSLQASQIDGVMNFGAGSSSPTAEQSPEIKELARSLENDPVLIYEYVHNTIHYSPYFGSLKGSLLTYYEKAGNDFDQASLLIALLQASGYTAEYVYGAMDIPYVELQKWLDVDLDINTIHEVLSSGGIPHTGYGGYVQLQRCWVRATINGIAVELDPAFKHYEHISGIDLKAAAQYGQSSLLSVAGGEVGADYVRNINETGLDTALNGYTMNLVEYIRQNYPNASMNQIVGGREILPVYFTALPTSLPFPYTEEESWPEVDSAYVHTVRIQHGGIDETLPIAAVAGKKLAITYEDQPAVMSLMSSNNKLQLEPVSDCCNAFKEVPSLGADVAKMILNVSPSMSASSAQTEVHDIDIGQICPHVENFFLYGQQGITFSNPTTNTSNLTYNVYWSSHPAGITSNGGYGLTSTNTTNTYVIAPGGSFNINFVLNGTNYQSMVSGGPYVAQFIVGVYNSATNKLLKVYKFNFNDVYFSRNLESLVLLGVDFGSRHLNDTIDYVAEIENGESASVEITSLGLSNSSNFSILSGGYLGSIGAGQARDIQVRYLANAIGEHSGTIDLTLKYDRCIYSSALKLVGETLSVPRAQLWLEDTIIAQETAPVSGGGLGAMTLSIDHPYVGNGGTFCDQSATYNLKRGAKYVIISALEADKNGLLKSRQKKLNDLLAAGYAEDSREVVTEALQVMGQTWLKETALNRNLLAELGGARSLSHHRFGITAQEEGFYVDVKNQFVTTPSRRALTDQTDAFFRASGHLGSALEHGVLEQLQYDTEAASTVKLLKLANEYGLKIFSANDANYGSIEPELVNYSSTDMSEFASATSGGSTFILPMDGKIALKDWKGKGYIKYTDQNQEQSLGMVIGGDYFGGHAATPKPFNPAQLNTLNQPKITPPVKTYKPSLSSDPVDLKTGAFLYDNNDLALGGSEPLGLSFSRFYTSEKSEQKSALGNGWTHNYNVYISTHSDGATGLGERRPEDAAPLIVASMATIDLMENIPDCKDWVTSALIADWAMDKLHDNAVSVNLGSKVMTFTALPDGSFVSPPGVTTKLVQQSDLYQLEERFGTKIHFNADDKIASWVDVDGNTLGFTYQGDKLKTATDAYGRTLTFNYSNGLLASVADSAGRSVSFGYDENQNLIGISDVEQKYWQYGYDEGIGLLTTVTDPMGLTQVTNDYSDVKTVQQQTFLRESGAVVYKIYANNYRGAEKDPEGHTVSHNYDDKGRTVRTVNELGQVVYNFYDGNDHIVKTIDPRGNTTSYEYDAFNNNTKIINALGERILKYYNYKNELIIVFDNLDHLTMYDYDTEHHPVEVTTFSDTQDPQSAIITSTSYFSDGLLDGLPQSTTDARNISTLLTYDSFGNLDTSKTGSQPLVNFDYDSIGQLTKITDQAGGETIFEYNKRGQITKRIDPFGKETVYTYLNNGRLLSVQDRDYFTTSYSYTPSGQLNTVDHLFRPDLFFDYDDLDRLTSMTDGLGTARYEYDATGRLVESDSSLGYKLSYDYNKQLLSSVCYATGKDVVYSYDEVDRVKSIAINWLPGSPTASYDYDAAGRLLNFTNFNGSTVDYTYDDAGRLVGLVSKRTDGTVIASYDYTLDKNGNRTSIYEEMPDVPYYRPKDAMDYFFFLKDPYGNNTARMDYMEDRLDWGNVVKMKFGFDYEGNQIYAFAQDDNNRDRDMISYSDENHRIYELCSGDGDTAKCMFYEYDGAGNRLKATREDVEARYVYDMNGNMIAETDAANNPTRFYIYGHGLTAMIDVATGQLYCYHFDGTGNTVAVTDSNNNIVNSYRYAHFGAPSIPPTDSIQVDQPFTYSGQHGVMTEVLESVDLPGGGTAPSKVLYYMRARYYDPDTARFLSEDPAGFEGSGVNLYVYAGNNPVVRVDPNGEAWLQVIGGILGGGGNLAYQLYNNGGDFSQVDWVETASWALTGSGVGSLARGLAASGFRAELGKWGAKGSWSNSSTKIPHLHLGRGSGLNKHHLPYQAGNWAKNLKNVAKQGQLGKNFDLPSLGIGAAGIAAGSAVRSFGGGSSSGSGKIH